MSGVKLLDSDVTLPVSGVHARWIRDNDPRERTAVRHQFFLYDSQGRPWQGSATWFFVPDHLLTTNNTPTSMAGNYALHELVERFHWHPMPHPMPSLPDPDL